MQVLLNPGDYVSAGVDLPWIATHGMVESALTSMGFSGFQWKGEDANGIEAVSATYNGPVKYYDLPSQVKWVNVTPKQGPAAAVMPVSQDPVQTMQKSLEHLEPEVMVGIGLLELSFTWLLASLFRRRHGK